MRPRRIRLLGEPAIFDETGREQPIRGHKAWALLTRLLLARISLDRRTLAAELFDETDDPLGALRWCLASLRKALAAPEAFRGDPIRCALPPDVGVDLVLLERGETDVEEAGELLEGIEPRCGPAFATWLLVERERIASLVTSRLREAAIRALSLDQSGEAIRLSERLVRRNPFDEGAHVLLVKALAQAGRHEAALAHVEATEASFLAELSAKPSPALRSAARTTIASPPAGISRTAFVNTLIESGLAALSAGAPDAGVDQLRRAAQDAESTGEGYLLPRALLELGSALVHFARGYADEGSVYLRQATDLARERGYGYIAATGLRELGFLESKVGRRPAAAEYLSQALDVAEHSETLSGIHAVIGMNLVDWGRVETGSEHFELALEHARVKDNRRREIFARANGARGHMAAGRLNEAEQWLRRCLTLVEEQRWIAFRPWPQTLLGQIRLKHGDDPSSVRSRLEDAFALSCQLADPCWEGAVARSIALTHVAEAALTPALDWLAEGRRRCVRETNRYVAIQVEILADQTETSFAQGNIAHADAFAREWLSLAARTHMDAHVTRAAQVISTVGRGR
jgi:DNA-binding SARP family transcriptional activator